MTEISRALEAAADAVFDTYATIPSADSGDFARAAIVAFLRALPGDAFRSSLIVESVVSLSELADAIEAEAGK